MTDLTVTGHSQYKGKSPIDIDIVIDALAEREDKFAEADEEESYPWTASSNEADDRTPSDVMPRQRVDSPAPPRGDDNTPLTLDDDDTPNTQGRLGESDGTPSALRQRISVPKLSLNEQIALVRWAIQHSREYRQSKSRFQVSLRRLFLEEFGRELKHPNRSLARLVRLHKEQKKRIARASGEEFSDPQLVHALDEWVQILDDIERVKQEVSEQKEAAKAEKRASIRLQNNMMTRMADRLRENNPSDGPDSGTDSAQGHREDFSEPPTKRRRRLDEITIDRTVANLTNGMKEALNGMAERLSQIASQPEGSAASIPPEWMRQIQERQNNLESRLTEMAQRHEERQLSLESRLEGMQTSLGKLVDLLQQQQQQNTTT